MKMQRFMMRFLRKRGWVVFYLEKRARTCKGNTCWMQLYQEQLERDDQAGKDKWFCAKCDPDTDEGEFLLSLGHKARSTKSG